MMGHWQDLGPWQPRGGWAKLPGFSLCDPLGTIFTVPVSVFGCQVMGGSEQGQQSLEGRCFPTTRLHRDAFR